MNTPEPFVFLLLCLAVFRVYRLIAEDTILDGPRNRLLRLSAGWRDVEGYVPPPEYRAKWAVFLTCPWCLGHWVAGVALATYCLVVEWIGFFSFFVCWFAIGAVAALIAKTLDSDEE